MINNKKILAIIPAKKNSKRLKNKNIKLLNGKPLFLWSVINAKKSKYIDKIIVSSDSKNIVKLALLNGVDAPFLRPKYLSTSNSLTEDVILHTINYLKKKKLFFDYFILLQPTSPLRNRYLIDSSIEKILINKRANSLISCNRTSKNKEKKANVLIYISKINEFIENKSFYNNHVFFNTKKIFSVDIDYSYQFEIAKKILKN